MSSIELFDLKKISIHSHILLVALVGFFLVAESHRLSDGPNGYHKWRESDTATVAENFALDGMDFWHPRVNVIGDAGDGIVGMELPIYNYATAVLYKTFGFSHVWPRLLSILAGVLGTVGIWRLASQLSPKKSFAILCAWSSAWSPLFYFYAHKIQPDVLGLSLSIWGMYFFSLWRSRQAKRYAWLATLCLVASGGIKPTFLAIGLPMLWLLSKESYFWRKLRSPGLIFFASAVLLVPTAWLAYARYLTSRYGDPYFFLGGNLAEELRGLFKVSFYQNVFLTWPVELALGIPAFFAALFALFHRQTRQSIPTIVIPWFCGAGVVLVLAAEHCATPHDYYYLVMLPPFTLLAASGFQGMLSTPRWRVVAIGLLVVMPFAAYGRVYGRFETPPDFFEFRRQVALAAQPTADSQPQSYLVNVSGLPLTLSIDAIPGELLYLGGLRGFSSDASGGPSYFERYRSRGVSWLILRKTTLDTTPWLSSFVGQRVLEKDGIIVAKLK